MKTSKEIMQMRHKTLWKWHRSPLQRMGIMQCIRYTTAPASSSSLPTRGIKYISRDISSQCLGQKHNSTDVASVTSLPSRDSPGKVDPKCVSSHCLCLLNASRCETSEKKKDRKEPVSLNLSFRSSYTFRSFATTVSQLKICEFSGESFKGSDVLEFTVSATTTRLLSGGEFCKLRYDTIPVKSASVNVPFYTDNSKMPNFVLRHSCRKWAICYPLSNTEGWCMCQLLQHNNLSN
jgi:hypothetical protein